MSDFIEVYDETLDAQLCQQLIAKFDGSQHVVRGRVGAGVDLEKKDSFDLTISDDPDWQILQDRVMEPTIYRLVEYARRYPFLLAGALSVTVTDPATGAPTALDHETLAGLEDMQVIRVLTGLYRPGKVNIQRYLMGRGGYHHWHSELYPRDADCDSLHRVLFFLHYLNTVEAGGETEFFFQRRKVAPQQGRLVIAPAGFTHTHKGHVPVSEDKYVLTSWILFQRAEFLYGPAAGS